MFIPTSRQFIQISNAVTDAIEDAESIPPSDPNHERLNSLNLAELRAILSKMQPYLATIGEAHISNALKSVTYPQAAFVRLARQLERIEPRIVNGPPKFTQECAPR